MGNDFYYKNALEMIFSKKNVFEMIFTKKMYLKWFLL